jgi:hypothetical protein
MADGEKEKLKGKGNPPFFTLLRSATWKADAGHVSEKYMRGGVGRLQEVSALCRGTSNCFW